MDTDVTISTGTNRLHTVSERRAKRLLTRLKAGEPMQDAVRAERTTMAEIKDPRSPIRASLEQLVGQYFIPPEARRQMIRAGLNKLFIENVVSEDPMKQKTALDAAKQISLDPEVGLQQDQGGGVIVNIGDLEGVFKQLRKTMVPEIHDGREQRTDGILEGEFENAPVDGDGSESPSVPTMAGGQQPGEDGSEIE